MISLFESAFRPFLLMLEPEIAHKMTIAALKRLPAVQAPQDSPLLHTEVFGLSFSNPIGVAAGFDKNAEAFDVLLGLGFGFVEVGTVTPHPQSGNPQPRLFRLEQDKGIINRFGFNSSGHSTVLRRFAACKTFRGIIGVNVGANKHTADRIADYVAGVKIFSPYASYFTLNISSPNTPGLRDLQSAAILDELLARVIEARNAARVQRPLLLKIAPDLSLQQLDDIVEAALRRGVDGIIVSNTTLARPKELHSFHKNESGGLSGKPLFAASTKMLAQTYRRTQERIPLIGVGGIDSPKAAWEKVEAGATLIQLYSPLVYEGIGLIGRIKKAFVQRMVQEGLSSLTPVVGRKADEEIYSL